MARTHEKIKDIVEPQVFDEVRNVAADPMLALAAYRFTDVTSDLLSRWLDALANLPRGRGAARALAGSRGVGKSHTLAVFGALAGSDKLRTVVADGHIATSARRLLGRYTVVRVERGLRETLAEEMAAAFTRVFGGNEVQWGEDPAQMLAVAASRAVDSTLVVVVDTAFERPARVQRDDGAQLAALAAVSHGVNAFVCLALDDDIAGADGPNVAIAKTYQIDYLDPEHLYRVVDQFVLRKHPQARSVLHEIYVSLLSTVPGFNWSEPRFAGLYPVHPLVADVSPAVRLYAPAFAFLPFAAEAAARAVTRPATSLVLLDDVFDRVEPDLRRSGELREAFAAYDDLAARAVAQFPLMQRHEAKLVLKSLFVLSLDGRGATARELCAALLMSDEQAATPEGAADAAGRVGETLTRLFEAASPGPLHRIEDGGGGTRYRFQVGASAALDAALDESVARSEADDAEVAAQLRGLARSRFEDWPLADEPGQGAPQTVNFHLNWRGSERAGVLAWRSAGEAVERASDPGAARREWELDVLAPGAQAQSAAGGADAQDGRESGAWVSVVWEPAELSAEERSVLRRLLVLRRDAALLQRFGETALAALSTLSAQAERVWSRVYMFGGALVVNGMRQGFNDRVRAARTLSAALSDALAPYFGARYPEHPLFIESLGEAQAARLVEGMFGGAPVGDADVQRLMRVFALPLGLAVMRGDACTFETGEEATNWPWVKEVLRLVDEAGGAVVPLEEVRRALGQEPYGLMRDAQNLVLAALVAQRRGELVSAGGEHLRPRPAGGAVRWDEVAGVCRNEVVQSSAEELTEWARRLTGATTLAAFADEDSRRATLAALAAWLESWEARSLFDAAEDLPDGALTLRVWTTCERVRRTFGAVAETVGVTVAGHLQLEEGLQRVAEAFDNSPDIFALRARQLSDLSGFVEGFAAHERARAYLSASEPTGVDSIESARRELTALAEEPAALLDSERRERFERLWSAFQERYAEHYAEAHERAAGACEDDRRALEAVLASERWREFEMLSRLSLVNRRPWQEAEGLLRRNRAARCDLPVRQLLAAEPRCACGFRPSDAGRLGQLPQELEDLAARGVAACRRTLELFRPQLCDALNLLAKREDAHAKEARTRARILATALAQGATPERFSRGEVRLIEHALNALEGSTPVRVSLPVGNYGLLTREELGARLGQWLDDLPNHGALVEVVTEKELDAA